MEISGTSATHLGTRSGSDAYQNWSQSRQKELLHQCCLLENSVKNCFLSVARMYTYQKFLSLERFTTWKLFSKELKKIYTHRTQGSQAALGWLSSHSWWLWSGLSQPEVHGYFISYRNYILKKDISLSFPGSKAADKVSTHNRYISHSHTHCSLALEDSGVQGAEGLLPAQPCTVNTPALSQLSVDATPRQMLGLASPQSGNSSEMSHSCFWAPKIQS